MVTNTLPAQVNTVVFDPFCLIYKENELENELCRLVKLLLEEG